MKVLDTILRCKLGIGTSLLYASMLALMQQSHLICRAGVQKIPCSYSLWGAIHSGWEFVLCTLLIFVTSEIDEFAVYMSIIFLNFNSFCYLSWNFTYLHLTKFLALISQLKLCWQRNIFVLFQNMFNMR